MHRWSRNGHDLVYQSGDQIMAASYTVKGDTFVAEKPRVWIAKLGGTEWDLAPDGKRVLVLTPVESAGSAQAGARGRVPRKLLRRAAAARARGQVSPLDNTFAWLSVSLRDDVRFVVLMRPIFHLRFAVG